MADTAIPIIFTWLHFGNSIQQVFSDVMSDIFMLFGLKYTHMNGRDADACGYVKHDDIIFPVADLPWIVVIAALFLR